MPDRAVVDDDELTAEEERSMQIYTPKALLDQLDEEEYEAAVERYKASLPRAVVAISEDRQWLVVLDPEGFTGWFVRYRINAYGHWVPDKNPLLPSSWCDIVEDTGQSADEVLREWEEERNG